MLREVTEPAIARPPGTATSRAEQAVELGVFLLLIVPSLALSLFIVQGGTISFPLAACDLILRDLALVALVWFFLCATASRSCASAGPIGTCSAR